MAPKKNVQIAPTVVQSLMSKAKTYDEIRDLLYEVHRFTELEMITRLDGDIQECGVMPKYIYDRLDAFARGKAVPDGE